MKLEEQGKLSIKDSIGKWLPRKYPNVDGAITIEQVLNHSSGLYDYLNDDVPLYRVFAAFYNQPSRRWTPDQILDTFVGVPNFKPGTSYRYCNTNFLLAGIVAEQAGGEKLGKMIHSYFIDPLKLTHTYFGGEDSVTIPFAHIIGIRPMQIRRDRIFMYSIKPEFSQAHGEQGIYARLPEILCNGEMHSIRAES